MTNKQKFLEQLLNLLIVRLTFTEKLIILEKKLNF
jgi:hypothetical protein